MRFIEKAIHLEETNGSFNSYSVIAFVNVQRSIEDDVYIQVFKAIEEEYLLPVYPFNTEVNNES